MRFYTWCYINFESHTNNKLNNAKQNLDYRCINCLEINSTNTTTFSHPMPLPQLLLLNHLPLPYFHCYCYSCSLLLTTTQCALYAGLLARRLEGIPRAGHESGYKLDVLNWLPFHQRIIFRSSSLVWQLAWTLPRLVCANFPVPLRVPEVIAPFTLRNLLLVPFTNISKRLNHATSCETGFHWRYDYSSGPTTTDSIRALKLFFIAVLGSGAMFHISCASVHAHEHTQENLKRI